MPHICPPRGRVAVALVSSHYTEFPHGRQPATAQLMSGKLEPGVSVVSDGREYLENRVAEDGIEFFFAMFVDMHGKPCAKLVPSSAMDVLMGGAGFAGFAAGPMGQTPGRPRHDRRAGPFVVHQGAVAGRAGRGDVRHPGRGRAVALHPPGDLAQPARQAAPSGASRSTSAWRPSTSWSRREEGGGIELADPLDTAAAPCYDAKGLTRMYDHLTTVSRYMNQLGWTQLRQRPRGRQRPVRAELQIRRRARPRPTG